MRGSRNGNRNSTALTAHEKTLGFLGGLGALLVLTAYSLTNLQLLAVRSLAYDALNIVGSAFIVVNARVRRDYPALMLNVIWIGIAIASVFSLLASH